MKNLLKPLFVATSLIFGAITFTSCADENSGLEGPGDGTENPIDNGNGTVTKTYKLNVTASELTPELEITAQADKTQEITVHFEGADKAMRRLYITKNDGTGRVIYDINNYIAPAASLNEDGSIDLSTDNKESLTFNIPFATPSSTNGTIVYKLWTTNRPFTSSKGDIQNEAFRNSYSDIAYGTIIIKAGNGNTTNAIKEFTVELNNAVELYAPDLYGKTETFVSVLTGTPYLINKQGKDVTSASTYTEEEKAANAEFVSYWDFGYFYTTSKGASFSSAYDYMNAFTNSKGAVVNITNISGLDQNQLNTFYFKKDNSISFDSVSNSADLEAVSVTTSDAQTINNLKTNDVIQFKDSHGNKGLIKINSIKAGTGNKDFIKFSIKVQDVDYIKL